MRKFFLALIVLAGFVSPAAAQNCDDPSGFLKSFGTIPIGDVLLLGPGCQQVQDGGPGGAVGTLPARTVVCNPTGAPALATTCPPALARSSSLLNIDSLTAIADTNVIGTAADRTYFVLALSAPRTLTLADPSTVNPGQRVSVVDDAGVISSTNTLTIAVGGTGLIHTCGASIFPATVVLNTPGQSVEFISNGSNLWVRVCPVQAPFVQSVQTATNNLSLTIQPSAVYAEFWLVGGGGGGAGSGTTPAAAGAGGQSCIGTNATACTSPTFTAGGGGAGATVAGNAAAGGTASGCQDNLTGGIGGAVSAPLSQIGGGGGASSRGGQGMGGPLATGAAVAGSAASAGSGSGGGGASDNNAQPNQGGGGGGGGTCHGIIFAPFVSLFATIGGAGSAGSGGTGGANGGAGGSGSMFIVWHFN